MNKLLLGFEALKLHNDETFKFVKYPCVNKYQYVISNYGRVFLIRLVLFVKNYQKRVQRLWKARHPD